MNPQEKRLKTIKERYGSMSNMLKRRDVSDLILGGFNGGIVRTAKGFSKWEKEELRKFTAKRQRDSKGRFISKKEETDSRH